MGSLPGGIRSGWDQESQAEACFVFQFFIENIPRTLFLYNVENSSGCFPSSLNEYHGKILTGKSEVEIRHRDLQRGI